MIKKGNRHGKHKLGYIRPEFRTFQGKKEYREKWNKWCRERMRNWRTFCKSLQPKITFETLPFWKKCSLKRYWNKLGRPWNSLEYQKGKKGCLLFAWNKRWEKKPVSEIIKKGKNAVLVLENKKYNRPVVDNARIGEIDIDVLGFTALFPNCTYNSRKIGSVKFLFKYRERDCSTKNGVQIGKCKFDFKVTGHSYFAGSTHEKGDLYDLKRSFADYFINNNKVFASSSEAYQFVIYTIKEFLKTREMKAMKFETQIAVPPK